MSENNTDACYEFFNCKELTCFRREDLTQQCWEIDDVRCQSHSKQFDYIKKQFNNKLESCKLCMYYQIKNGTIV